MAEGPVGPLFGRRVLVTRAAEQAGSLAGRLAERGARPLELATIRFAPPEDWTPTDRAIDRLSDYDWIVFTSANGVRYFWERLMAREADPQMSVTARIVAIGPATAAALAGHGARADLIPETFVAEAVVAMMGQYPLAGQKVLIPTAAEAREVLIEGLAARGAMVNRVTVYRTLPGGDPELARQWFATGQVDLVTLTSPSTARGLVRLLGDAAVPLLNATIIASIGPITSAAARALGLTIQIEATEQTIAGLIGAIESALGPSYQEEQTA